MVVTSISSVNQYHQLLPPSPLLVREVLSLYPYNLSTFPCSYTLLVVQAAGREGAFLLEVVEVHGHLEVVGGPAVSGPFDDQVAFVLDLLGDGEAIYPGFVVFKESLELNAVFEGELIRLHGYELDIAYACGARDAHVEHVSLADVPVMDSARVLAVGSALPLGFPTVLRKFLSLYMIKILDLPWRGRYQGRIHCLVV